MVSTTWTARKLPACTLTESQSRMGVALRLKVTSAFPRRCSSIPFAFSREHFAHEVGVGHRSASGCTPLDFVDMLHACDHLTPNGVISIEKICGIETDEELTVGTVRQRGSCHRTGAPDMLSLIEFSCQVGFVRTAGSNFVLIVIIVVSEFPSPVWAMKPSITRWKVTPSYRPSSGKLFDSLHMIGSVFGKQFDFNRPVLKFNREQIFSIVFSHCAFVFLLPTDTFFMMSGFATEPLKGLPRLIFSTLSIPSITCPQTVYCPSRWAFLSKQIKIDCWRCREISNGPWSKFPGHVFSC